MLVATHSGPFHCDDVFAGALLRSFLDADLRFVRTRELSLIAEADIAIDVGGQYDPAQRRFDHHQRDYQGTLSSAGMVLSWLEGEGHVPAALATKLRTQWVDYIDAVDIGARKPEPEVPCLPSVIGSLCEQARTQAEFDARYGEAVQMCTAMLNGVRTSHLRTEQAREAVGAAQRAHASSTSTSSTSGSAPTSSREVQTIRRTSPCCPTASDGSSSPFRRRTRASTRSDPYLRPGRAW